ncbi:hypothetical protein COCNU_scaffold003335G000050 [Cocos nucifera]|nr:hypothetical protein [Cocos nucifera]
MLQDKGLMPIVDIASMTADPSKVRVDQYFIYEETHPTIVDTTIAHSSEVVEVSYVAGVKCEKEGAAAKLVSSLCKRITSEGRERKPIEKGKATSYLPKTYKRARK